MTCCETKCDGETTEKIREVTLSGSCGERRNLLNGGAEAAQSIWVVESCFSKTFTEPSDGGSAALTESTSGKSCAVAQKAASYSPNACSRTVELSLNGEGAFAASLG